MKSLIKKYKRITFDIMEYEFVWVHNICIQTNSYFIHNIILIFDRMFREEIDKFIEGILEVFDRCSF